jgi:hypothetical protein
MIYPDSLNVPLTLDVFPPNTPWLSRNWSLFTLTFNFSQPISSINIYQAGGDVSENYTFNTNTGVPTLTAHYINGAAIQGNMIAVFPDTHDGEGNSLVIVSNPTPFTSLTISGWNTPPGRPINSLGSIFAICTQLV